MRAQISNQNSRSTAVAGQITFPRKPFRLPPDKQDLLDRAKRLEWITIVFLLSIIAVTSVTMGSSQTMKAMWTEDLLSLVPPIAFLIGTHFFHHPPDKDFPY